MKPHKRAALREAIWNPNRPKLMTTTARERRLARAREKRAIANELLQRNRRERT